jgi:putative heme transporter
MTDSDSGERGMLERVAATALQIFVLAIVGYFVVWVARKLYIVVIPCAVGLLFTALLRPAVLWLRRKGAGAVGSTWLTIIGFWLLLAAISFGVVARATADIPKLVDETTATIQDLRDFALRGPLHVSQNRIDHFSTTAINYLNDHRDALTTSAVAGAVVITEVITGAILAFFIGFFLMYDGERIFGWLVGFAPRRHRSRLWSAGSNAWTALSGYVRGTLLVAVFHGVVMGVTLSIMGVPLALPLAVLIAFGSLIPLVGAVVFGGIAVLVTLVTQGWLLAVVLVGILVAENQAEAHLLQPFVVGRYVHLHPLAIALALTTGTVFGGVWGALFAVPFTAAVWAAYSAVRTPEEEPALPRAPVRAPEDDSGSTRAPVRVPEEDAASPRAPT